MLTILYPSLTRKTIVNGYLNSAVHDSRSAGRAWQLGAGLVGDGGGGRVPGLERGSSGLGPGPCWLRGGVPSSQGMVGPMGSGLAVGIPSSRRVSRREAQTPRVLMEIDPAYCDVTIRRWMKLTGLRAEIAKTPLPMNQVEK